MKSVTINSIEELVEFLKSNFDNLTDSDYSTLIKQSLDLYCTAKPKTLEIAINDILEAWEIVKQYPQERPIFIHDVGQYSFVDELTARTKHDWNKIFKEK